MRFILIDRILEYEKGKSLRALKNLSLAEEYLQDHFPQKPVMPGVMMLESLIQAGAWLARLTNDFKYSVVILQEAKTIRYGKFVNPGDPLEVDIDWKKEDGAFVEVAAKGTVKGETVVSARLKLKQFNPSDSNSALKESDEKRTAFYRGLLSQIVSENLVNV